MLLPFLSTVLFYPGHYLSFPAWNNRSIQEYLHTDIKDILSSCLTTLFLCYNCKSLKLGVLIVLNKVTIAPKYHSQSFWQVCTTFTCCLLSYYLFTALFPAVSYLFFHSAKLRVQGLEVVPVVSLSIHSCLNILESHLAQPVQRVQRD